jgi:hypothetical protein
VLKNIPLLPLTVISRETLSAYNEWRQGVGLRVFSSNLLRETLWFHCFPFNLFPDSSKSRGFYFATVLWYSSSTSYSFSSSPASWRKIQGMQDRHKIFSSGVQRFFGPEVSNLMSALISYVLWELLLEVFTFTKHLILRHPCISLVISFCNTQCRTKKTGFRFLHFPGATLLKHPVLSTIYKYSDVFLDFVSSS